MRGIHIYGKEINMNENEIITECKDLHNHTYLSYCGDRDVHADTYIPYCKQEKVTTIGYSNHVYYGENVLEGRFFKTGALRAADMRDEVDKINASDCGVRALLGCEGELFYKKEPSVSYEEAKMFDYVLLSPSHINNYYYYYQRFIDVEDVKTMQDLLVYQFKRACSLEYPVPVGIAHPFYPLMHRKEQEIVDGISDSALADCFSLAAKNGISIELHACLYRKGTALDGDGLSPTYMRILSAAKACGCKFHFGSDSHRVKMFVGTHEKLLLAAKKIGITKNDIWDI